MKKIMPIVIVSILLIYSVQAYTPPVGSHITLILDVDYTPPVGSHITLVLSDIITDTCTCPGDSSAHEFDCSDFCVISSCTAGDVTFINSGNVTCTGDWSVTDIDNPVDSGCRLWIGPDCHILKT